MSSKFFTRRFTSEFSLEDDHNQRKLESLSVSKRLAKKLTQKTIHKKPERKQFCNYLIEERASAKKKPSNCINFYIKSSGCNRIISCEEIDVNGIKKLSISDGCLPLKAIDMKNSRKSKNIDQTTHEISLPDDVIEMILLRSNFKTMAVGRVVCKKWNEMITSSQFTQLRQKLNYNSPWLFLFGLTKKGKHLGEIFALNIADDSWVTIQNNNLKDKFLYSVTNIGPNIYIVGGCSMLTTHKEATVFSPTTNSWREISPMNVARSEPILGVFKLHPTRNTFRNPKTSRSNAHSSLNLRSSDVYGDPHRFSLRRKRSTLVDFERNTSNPGCNNFALIVVGGSGSCNERLDSGEIYDPTTDQWTDISTLPEEIGSSVSSGVVHDNKFYVYSTSSNKLARYDIESGCWALIQTEQPPCIRSFEPRLICWGNRVFMCCVCWSDRTEQATRMLWELDTEVGGWSVVSKHPDAPMDKRAIFCVGGDRVYGLEMFKVFGQGLDFLTAGRVSGDGVEWSRVSRRHIGREGMDSGSVQSMVVLHL